MTLATAVGLRRRAFAWLLPDSAVSINWGPLFSGCPYNKSYLGSISGPLILETPILRRLGTVSCGAAERIKERMRRNLQTGDALGLGAWMPKLVTGPGGRAMTITIVLPMV